MISLSIAAILLALDLLVGSPQKASAFYYDPGFGSVVTQLVFAAWLAGIVLLGRFRQKITDLLKSLTRIRQ